MRGIGWTLIVIGLGLVLWSTGLTTTVHTDASYVGGIAQEASDTYNLGLLQQQMMLLQAGLALFIAGTIAACIGDLKISMRRANTAKYEGILEGGVFDEAQPSPQTPKQDAAAE